MKTNSLLKLILPLMLLQFIEFGSMFVDAIMVGNYDPIKFGAVSLSGGIYYTFFTFFFGIILMLGPLIGQAHGVGNKDLVARNLRGGIFIGALFFMAMYFICTYIVTIVAPLNFSTDIIVVMEEFLAGKKYSTLIFLAFPFRYFLINQGVVKPVLVISVIAFPLNIILNYFFIYGYGFIPEMGVYGAGLATSVAMIFTGVILMIYANTYAHKKSIPIYKDFFKPDFEIYKRIFKYGIPSGIALTLEMVLFSVSNIYVAYLDPYSISAFGALYQFWNLTYALAIGFSEGIAISIANSAGKKDYATIIATLKKATVGVLILVVGLCSVYYFFSPTIFMVMMDRESPDTPAILAILQSLKLLMVIGLAVETCIHLPTKFLQGINDTKYIPVAQFIGYGLIGPVIGYILCFVYDFKVDGLLIAMIIGITTTLLLIIGRVVYILHESRIFTNVQTK